VRTPALGYSVEQNSTGLIRCAIPQDAGLEFLLDLVGTESLDAEAAIEAILRSMPSSEIIQRLERSVASNLLLARAFATHQTSQR